MTKRILFLSFDIHRKGEPTVSYSIGCLIAAIKHSCPDWHVELKNLDASKLEVNNLEQEVQNQIGGVCYKDYSTIAVSAYVWNEFCLNPLLELIVNKGFKGKFVAGGYQITYAQKDELKEKYPLIDIFISGQGESAIVEVLNNTSEYDGKAVVKTPDYENLISPYVSGVIEIDSCVKKVRMETKRGCPYKCTFCAHRDLGSGKSVNRLEKRRYVDELHLFKKSGIERINVIDPIFNMKIDESIEFIDQIKSVGLSKTEFTFQCRMEYLAKNGQDSFLKAVSEINAHLEFGLQTVIRSEYEVIERKNDRKKIEMALEKLSEFNISFEVSLIYGLPNQTVDSFKESIDFLKDRGCNSIVAFPLMLLKGTELFNQKEKWGFVEEEIGEYRIPTVVSSNTFGKQDWLAMQEIAHSLGHTGRVAA